MSRLIAAGGAITPALATGYVVPFDPELLKLAALELLDEAGVQFLFHAFASGVLADGPLRGVVFETKSGPIVIRARAIVDCTGDGDVAAAAGARFEVGREADGLVQPMTLMFRMVEFDRAGVRGLCPRASRPVARRARALGPDPRGAAAEGELDLPREDILFFGTPHAREVSVNSTRVTGVLGTDVFDWSYAEWQSRRQLRQIVQFLRRRVPGFERAYLVQSGVHAGVRETRRIRGDYRLTADDVLGARQFDDVDRPRLVPGRHSQPEGQRHRPEAAAGRGGLRHPAALPAAGGHRQPHRRRPLPLRQPRGALLLSRDADRHGDRPGGRGLRRARDPERDPASRRPGP